MITLTVPAGHVTPEWVHKLSRILVEHPGSESVRLHVNGGGSDCGGCTVLALNVQVDGSPELLLKTMGLLDA